MRRSVCYCEPRRAAAGEVNTWKFVYTTNGSLPKGTKLKFDLLSKGREIDWELPQTDLSDGKNIIFLDIEGSKPLAGKECTSEDGLTPCYEFTLPSKVDAGVPITINVGSVKNPTKNGTRAQTNSQRRRTFHLYVDPKGKGQYEEPEVFSLDIQGADLANIRVLAPSLVTRNRRFDVVVRFEDRFGNLTNEAPPETLVELSYENIRENLNWKLFIPETGFISLPNLYFNEAGVYTIQLLNTSTKEVFKSSPIMCASTNNSNIYWGLLHGESERMDSTENIENCLRYFRDDRACNFYASSPFESVEETPNDIWKMISQNISEFDEADRFTTFLGFQWMGSPGKEGLRQMFYTKDQKQILRKKDVKYSNLKNIYKNFTPKELISIPSWSMASGYDYNFKEFNPDFERVVEIYNAWGSSECTTKEGNAIPIATESKKGVIASAEGSIAKALQNNCRFGFVAGGLDDRGIFANLYDEGQMQYPPGLTAIIAPEHTKASLVDALYNRSCYATTGERIIVGFFIAGLPMGTETSTATKPGLRVNRHISGYVACTANISKIEIIRNGKVINTFETDNYWLEFTYDDMIAIEKNLITPQDKKPPFVYYYLKVTQVDGHTAWSSPIWIDFTIPVPVPKVVAKKTPTKPIKKQPLVDDDFDEDEDEFEDDEDDDFEE